VAHTITFENQQYTLRDQESVLDGLTRYDLPIPSSCRSGICQACLMRAVDTTPPAEAQKGLNAALRERNHFLACQCIPVTDMEVVLPNDADIPLRSAQVVAKESLSDQVVRVRLHCEEPLTYRAGQFINLKHQGLMRSYSLASVPEVDQALELHVQRVSNGSMSGWIHDEMAVGDSVQIQGPFGDCVYTPGNPQQPLLMIGTGCGLSPLWGVLRDALTHGHAAPIHLFHGSRNVDGLYLVDELRTLTERYPNFSYTPCLSGEAVPGGFSAGRVNILALAAYPQLKGWRVYLCGNTNMVKTTKKKVFLAGATFKDILADPFEFSHCKTNTATNSSSSRAAL
jgi:ferredoxin-NADP reductase/ferredoxin